MLQMKNKAEMWGLESAPVDMQHRDEEDSFCTNISKKFKKSIKYHFPLEIIVMSGSFTKQVLFGF